ncbi:MAG TPA: GNAT family N-acetyltransferase [Candidatus Limnocylindria bacterium]|nr:GNAT family N-acetyltransferase [Candidatus Limnocylindria bacterium]
MALAVPPRGVGPIPLGHGRWATIRPIESSDRVGLLDFYASLSQESRYTRFMSMGRGIGPGAAHDFADAHDRGAAGFVAILREPGARDGEIIGHLCLEPLADGAAEVAVAVADDVRRHGIGHLLMAEAMRASRELGFRRLVATMFTGNEGMRRLLLSAGGRLLRQQCRAGINFMELSTDPQDVPGGSLA